MLESFFSAARDEAAPSPALLARVLEDGYATQDQHAEAAGARSEAAAPPRARGPRGRLAAFLSAIGGAPGLAGLTAAGLAGLWIGISPPQGLTDVAGALIGTSSSSATTSVTAMDSPDDLLGYDIAYTDLLADG